MVEFLFSSRSEELRVVDEERSRAGLALRHKKYCSGKYVTYMPLFFKTDNILFISDPVKKIYQGNA
jgi:hypothetical protein